MRLTIFHNTKPEPLWEHSLNKLISPLSLKEIKLLGTDIHIAVFNDGVVGISASTENEITYLKVRDITRRRGVGKYLIEESCNFIFENSDYDDVFVNTKIFPIEEQDGAIYFLEMQGFVKNETKNDLYVFHKDANDD